MATRKQLCNPHDISCFMHTNTCGRLGLGWVYQSSLAGCHSFIRVGMRADNPLSTLYAADGKTKAAAQRPRVYGATGINVADVRTSTRTLQQMSVVWMQYRESIDHSLESDG